MLWHTAHFVIQFYRFLCTLHRCLRSFHIKLCCIKYILVSLQYNSLHYRPLAKPYTYLLFTCICLNDSGATLS